MQMSSGLEKKRIQSAALIVQEGTIVIHLPSLAVHRSYRRHGCACSRPQNNCTGLVLATLRFTVASVVLEHDELSLLASERHPLRTSWIGEGSGSPLRLMISFPTPSRPRTQAHGAAAIRSVVRHGHQKKMNRITSLTKHHFHRKRTSFRNQREAHRCSNLLARSCHNTIIETIQYILRYNAILLCRRLYGLFVLYPTS